VGDQLLVFSVLVASLGLFLWGRWRYDLVALGALLVLVFGGVIDPAAAFLGFGHPAVITVAAVLVVSRALERAGMVTAIVRRLTGLGSRRVVLIPVLTAAIILASGFMNNVGALAIFMPVAIKLARDADEPPSRLLMPLAFGSLLGGLLTLIGTPSNIIIGTFRGRETGEAFRMFDFLPAGSIIALAGFVFIAAVGWRLVPVRRTSGSTEAIFEIEAYLTELIVPDGSPLVGRRVGAIRQESDATLVGLVRPDEQLEAPSGYEVVRAGDRIVVETDSDGLERLVEEFGLEVPGSSDGEQKIDVGHLSLVEAVVAPETRAVGQSAESLNLPLRLGVNLLAVSRRGQSLRQRPTRVRLRSGDVVLLQGTDGAVSEAMETLGFLPLAQRSLKIRRPRRLVLAGVLFAVALALTATGILEVQVALTAAAGLMVVARVIGTDDAYAAIDWPIIVLIAAMIPVGEALETSGGAATIAGWLESVAGGFAPIWTLGLLLVVVMLLSNVINNAAAAVVMAPIAIGMAVSQGFSIDPFLMAVAVGAAIPVLTPIGHQSNVLVMGPGGFHFSDYWRLGLPLSAIVALVGPPAILWAWPLTG
jgi:di/tricarboxylate transporter